MAITKAQKQKIIENLKEKIARQKSLVFVDIKGLKVKDLSELRKKLKTVEAQLQVAKKTLLGLVFKETGLPVNPKEVQGQLALVFGFGEDIAPAKTIYEFSQSHPSLQMVGGFLDKKFISAQEIRAIGQLPGRKELLAKVAGSIAAPLSGFVDVLGGNIKGLVVALSAISKTK